MSRNLDTERLRDQLEHWRALRDKLRHLQLVRDLLREMGV